MKNLKGRVVTLYITPSGVRVVEGETKNGSPHIYSFFTVGGVSDYFAPAQNSTGEYEITNMTALVSAIVEECKSHHVLSRRLMISSNCLGLETVVKIEEGKGSLKDFLFGDLEKRKKQHKKKETDNSVPPGFMRSKVMWGEFADGVVKRVSTTTTGEKFVLLSLVREFYRSGYEVISVSDNVGSLINLRYTEESTFDSKGKIIVDFDEVYHIITMVQDLPLIVDAYPPMMESDLAIQIESVISRYLERTGRNPKLYFTGSLLSNTSVYTTLLDEMETCGYTVYDLFDRPETDPDTGKDPTTGVDVFTADYAVNIAMLLSSHSKSVVSVVPALDFREIFKKNSKAIASIVLVLSIIAFAGSGINAGLRFLKLKYIEENPPRVSSLESNLSMLTADQQSLNTTIDTLTKADSVVIDLLNFIKANQSDFVSVVSMDTMDMLEDSTSVSSNTSTVTVTTPSPAPSQPGGVQTETTVTGTTGGANIVREDIIIRGYARTGDAAIGYFNKLFNSGLPVDPVLNGVEKYTLPNGEEVYIFEIKVGGAQE